MMAENQITNLITNGNAFLLDLIGIKDEEDEKRRACHNRKYARNLIAVRELECLILDDVPSDGRRLPGIRNSCQNRREMPLLRLIPEYLFKSYLP